MEEKKERDFAKEVTLTVTSVEAKMDQRDTEVINQMVFVTNVGNITYRPKVNHEEYREGIKMLSQKPAIMLELPGIVKEISKKVQADGKCLVTASYSIWNTQKDGVDVTYRFIQGASTMLKWAILEEPKAEVETVM